MKIPYSSRVMAASLTLVASAVATAPAVATAADFSGLTIYDNSGGAHAFNATGLEMTPQGDNLIVRQADGSVTTLPLTSLAAMSFTGANNTTIVIADSLADTPVEIIDLSGRSLGTFPTLSAAKTTLEKGIYIVRSERLTLKIAL